MNQELTLNERMNNLETALFHLYFAIGFLTAQTASRINDTEKRTLLINSVLKEFPPAMQEKMRAILFSE